MQVAGSRTKLQEAVKERYLESDAYLSLKSGRQRDSSIKVLDFIASHGLNPVRRRDIRRAFMAGGKDRHKTKKKIEGLTDHELQRILDRLTSNAHRFLAKLEVTPPSTRGKPRSKPDVYYALSLSKVDRTILTMEDLEIYDSITGPILADLRVKKIADQRFSHLGMVPQEWMEIIKACGLYPLKITDEDVARWAESLPDDEAPLREQIRDYIGRNKDSKGPRGGLAL